MPYKKPTYTKQNYTKEVYNKRTYEKFEYGQYNTIQKLLAMFEINVETGRVTYSGNEPSENEEGYLYFLIEGIKRPIFCHKLVWMKVNNDFVPRLRHVHHVNHNRKDNRIANLQCVTKREHEKIHGKKFTFF